MRYIVIVLLLACTAVFAADGETDEKPKFDWTKPETVASFYKWTAAKYKWPASVKSTEISCSTVDKKAILGVMFEIETAIKDEMVKATYATANIIGQAMAQGAPVDKTGVIFKTPDGATALVALPPADLKKLGDESIKGPKADKAAINKMVGALIAKCDWKEVDALVKKGAEPKKEK